MKHTHVYLGYEGSKEPESFVNFECYCPDHNHEKLDFCSGKVFEFADMYEAIIKHGGTLK